MRAHGRGQAHAGGQGASDPAAEGSARECEARPEGKGSDRQKSGLSWRTRADIQPDDLNQLQA